MGDSGPSKAGHLHVSAKLVRWAEAEPPLRKPHRAEPPLRKPHRAARHVDKAPRHQLAGTCTASVRVPTCAWVRAWAWVRGEGVGVG